MVKLEEERTMQYSCVAGPDHGVDVLGKVKLEEEWTV